MCALHTAPVPLEALLEFWEGLPPEHCTALFRLRDEDFAAEVDAQLRYTLKICRDCRSNVMREYRQLKAGKGAAGGSPNEMEVCKGPLPVHQRRPGHAWREGRPRTSLSAPRRSRSARSCLPSHPSCMRPTCSAKPSLEHAALRNMHALPGQWHWQHRMHCCSGMPDPWRS